MKFAFGAAAAAALLLNAQALAQDNTAPAAPAAPAAPVESRCGALPPAPPVPDGATADRAAMTAATEAHNAWATTTMGVLDCRRAEAQEAAVRADALAREFNAGNAAARAASDAMVAQTEAFNARNRNRRR